LKEYNEHIDDLIAKVLSGEASEPELTAFDEWIALDEENVAYFQQMSSIMSHTAHAWDQKGIDVNIAWDKVNAATSFSVNVIQMSRRQGLRWIWSAAAVFLCVAITVVIVGRRNTSVEFALQTGQEIEKDTLTEGLFATLNRNSSLKVEKFVKSGKIVAQLSGEAHFQIENSDVSEFIVQSDDVFIRDIGTVFNVRAYDKSDSVMVLVTEGVVQLYTADNKGVQVNAGEVGLYLKSSGKFTVMRAVEEELENGSGYVDKQFRFRNTAVSKVIERLNNVYPEKLVLADESMGKCRIMATFDGDDIDVIVGVIAESMGWQVSKSGDVYTFEGPGCE
jgi:transmembrane sensor